MFLEPFGLLTVLPLPGWLKLFVPAYKATRIIAEIAMESLPQSILQGVIYVIVANHRRDGTATPAELAVVPEMALLPKSIMISTLATLKTWMELVEGARQAGLSVISKAVQLWNVGAGLPLDAMKKGAIKTWTCPYELHEAEVSPMIDALGKNASLTFLDLSPSGVHWDGPQANGTPLITIMAKFPSALSALEHMVISSTSGFRAPRLRRCCPRPTTPPPPLRAHVPMHVHYTTTLAPPSHATCMHVAVAMS